MIWTISRTNPYRDGVENPAVRHYLRGCRAAGETGFRKRQLQKRDLRARKTNKKT
jgi:hypothetical protein